MPLPLFERPALHLLLRRLCHQTATLLAGLLLVPALAQEPPTIRLGTPRPDGNYAGALLRRIYQEAFQRMGVRLEIATLPTARLTQELANGRIDGDLARPSAFGEQIPSLLRAEEPVQDMVVALWGIRPSIQLERLDQLGASGYTVNYVRGVVQCSDALQGLLPASRLHDITATSNALWMLHYERNDLHCGVDIAVLSDAGSPEFAGKAPLRKVLTLGQPTPLYGFFLPRHAALVEQFSQTLRAMKRDGTLERIRSATLRSYQLPSAAP